VSSPGRCSPTVPAVRAAVSRAQRVVVSAPMTNMAHVNVTISKVEASGPGGWKTISSTETTVDLLSLARNPMQLGAPQVAAGHYNQIRLFITKAQLVTTDGSTVGRGGCGGRSCGLEVPGSAAAASWPPSCQSCPGRTPTSSRTPTASATGKTAEPTPTPRSTPWRPPGRPSAISPILSGRSNGPIESLTRYCVSRRKRAWRKRALATTRRGGRDCGPRGHPRPSPMATAVAGTVLGTAVPPSLRRRPQSRPCLPFTAHLLHNSLAHPGGSASTA